MKALKHESKRLNKNRGIANTLKTLLRHYYHRKGNRVIFANGMTLNELANAMAEKLNTNFDGATLSRVVTGKRLFTASQLRAFCTVLEVSSADQLHLTKILAADVLHRAHFKQPLLYKKHLYTKFLEYVLNESHTVTPAFSKQSEETRLAAFVLDRIEKKVKDKYPKLWLHQTQALLGCELQSFGKSHYLLFQI